MAWWLGLHGLDEVPEWSGEGDPEEGILHLRVDGRQWRLSALGESATLADENGMTIYADIDGDGQVDHISTVHADGAFEVWSTDPEVAAWGLAAGFVPGEAESSVRDNDGWGLPSDGTPEMGDPEGVLDHVRGEWICVERG